MIKKLRRWIGEWQHRRWRKNRRNVLVWNDYVEFNELKGISGSDQFMNMVCGSVKDIFLND